MGADKVQQLRTIIKQRPVLMWSSNAFSALDVEAMAEAIYNYGSWEDVLEYHRILGIKTAEEVFGRLANKGRCNLSPKVRYFFRKYYDRHIH